MKTNAESNWILELSEEELEFVKVFILSSGSIKKMTETYSVSYPTIRKQLDKLIQKIKVNDRKKNDDVIRLIQTLEREGKIESDVADTVVKEYGKSLNCLISY